MKFDTINNVKINPNFIYNRFDLINSDNNEVIEIDMSEGKDYIPIHISNHKAILGIWLKHINNDVMQEVTKYLFKRHKQLRYIIYQNAIVDSKDAKKHNHFNIFLPFRYDELQKRISAKSRYTLRRKLNIMIRDFGNYTFNEFEVNKSKRDDKIESVINEYFEFKRYTHGVEYGLSPYEYLEKYHVSNIYVLSFKNITASILLSCEQCPIAYLENLTYNHDLAKYSPGLILYDMFLKKLIEHRKEELYLAGGDLEYKKHYGSIELQVSDGCIYRNRYYYYLYTIQRDIFSFLRTIYAVLPDAFKKIYRRWRDKT